MVTQFHVRAISMRARAGRIQAGGISVPCSLGRSGRRIMKREGDGATPVGAFALRRVFYRADRIMPPVSRYGTRQIREGDGWSETPGDPNYNRLVRLPYGAPHDTMRRADHLYDIVVELSHNERPRVQGLGSAVFLHLRRADGGATAGCVAVALKDMRLLLAHAGRGARLVIWGAHGPMALRRRSLNRP